MRLDQTEIVLPAYPRGFHLITPAIQHAVNQMTSIQNGMIHLLLQHTSASLTLNENADPSVRKDFETFFNRNVPENFPGFIHTFEGADDMPAHIKSSLMGSSLLVPWHQGQFRLGTWQGIYLGEHRDYGGRRKVFITAWGI